MLQKKSNGKGKKIIIIADIYSQVFDHLPYTAGFGPGQMPGQISENTGSFCSIQVLLAIRTFMFCI
jgi:hypothetical protein